MEIEKGAGKEDGRPSGGGKERDGPEVKGRFGGIWIITIIRCCHVPDTCLPPTVVPLHASTTVLLLRPSITFTADPPYEVIYLAG